VDEVGVVERARGQRARDQGGELEGRAAARGERPGPLADTGEKRAAGGRVGEVVEVARASRRVGPDAGGQPP